MKRFIVLAVCPMLFLAGCAKSGVDKEQGQVTEITSEAFYEHSDEEGKTDEYTEGTYGYDLFFDAYKKTENADSFTKEKDVEIVMFEETDHPYNINTKTYLEREKNGDEYNMFFSLDDEVDGNTNKMEGFYSDGYVYYDADENHLKQKTSWKDIKYNIDGYAFKLYDYTVSHVDITTYSDGIKKVVFTFNLQNLAEAPDEEIFEILAMTGTTYKNLSFNEATFEAYITEDGYVASYNMYYDGQVTVQKDANATDIFTFKYRTIAGYDEINNSSVVLPDNIDEYELYEPETEGSAE